MIVRDELRKLDTASTEWPFHTHDQNNPGVTIFLRLPWDFYLEHKVEDWEPNEFIYDEPVSLEEYMSEDKHAKHLERAIDQCLKWAFDQPKAHAFRKFIVLNGGTP